MPIERLRPAVYPPDAGAAWDELLRFRHFLRHAYAVPLVPERLRVNAERFARAVAPTEPHIHAIADALFAD